MTHELARLISQYQWLKNQSEHEGSVESAAGPMSVTEAQDRVFLDILRFPAKDPQVSYRQIAFMLELLADERRDADTRLLLRDAVLEHVKRMADQLSDRPSLN